MAILSSVELSLGYSDRVLLRNFSFDISNPSIVAIVGNNGCGKSTFLKAISGVQAYTGELKLFDKNIQDYSFDEISKKISFLGQQNHVNFSIPVIEIVVMGRFSNKGLLENYSHDDYLEAEEILGILEIGHLKDRDFVTLSGGEQQLVWIGQLLLQDSELILFDEPMQYLDIYYRNKILQIFSEAVNKKGKTIILSTHDLDSLRDVEGRIADLSVPEPFLENITPSNINRIIFNLKTRHLSK